MFTFDDYDALKTFAAIVEEKGGISALFPAGDLYDEATQENVLDWFAFRKVCDNDKFEYFFKRKLSMLARQYNGYLRVETTIFDPMVSEYLEREVKRVSDNSETRTKNTTANSSGTNSSSGTANTEHDRNDMSSTDSTQTAKKTGTEKTDTSGTTKQTVDGTNKRTLATEKGTTESGTVDTTQTTEDKRTDSGTAESTTTHDTKETADGNTTHKQLDGELPQSAQNADGGFPDALNWTYLTRQNESKDTAHNETAHTGTDKTEGKTGNTSEVKGTVTTDTDTTGKKTETESGTITDKADTETNNTENGSTTVTHNTTDTIENKADVTNSSVGTERTETTATGNSTTQTTGNETETKGGNGTQTDRERLTGRHEAPQDMLDRARLFIMKTNAFEWLRNELESCFMGIYEY